MNFRQRKISYARKDDLILKIKPYIVYGFLGCVGIMGVLLIYFSIGLPNPGDLKNMNLTQSTEIMDRNGGLLYAIHGDENRKSLDSLESVSASLVNATIAIEDDQFYNHFGIDIPAILRAVLSEVGIGSPRGGSTITQQFARNTFLSSERSYKRKIQEILLSLLIEAKFSKNEILLMYLNAIPYGSNAYGIELAAETYFGVEAQDLTLGESAVLASIPNAPTRYSPYGDHRYSTLLFEPTEDNMKDRTLETEADLNDEEWARGLIGKTYDLPDGSKLYLKGRSDLVLERMVELNMIDETEMTDALAEIQTLEIKPYAERIKAPHFVFYIKSLLEEKYGVSVVEQGGLKVWTTLDPDFQKAAEDAVTERKETNATNYGATNAAVLSVQPQTGQILAMVGSADYRDDEIDGQVNIITSHRQPGSSFKPFVYSLAFLNQYSPATVLYDVQTKIGNDTPQNYSGTFNGPVSIRYALGHSLNIPAIKAYFLAGQETALIPFIKSTFGFDSLIDDSNYGYPMALGAVEITPMEMAEGYSVFANGGTRVALTPILKITNATGDILEQWDESKVVKQETLDPQVAFLMNDILSDASVGLGPQIRIDEIDNAAKTGTSNKKLSNGGILPNNCWIAAYTPTLVTITWTGNANGDPMKSNADGYTTAAPIWKNYLTAISARLEATTWTKPDGIKEVAVSKASGKLPGPDTPSDMIETEIFASFSVPTEIDDAYQKVKVETISNRLATDYSPEEFVVEKVYRIHKSILADIWPSWQEGVDAWAKTQGEDQKPPTESADSIHNAQTASNAPQITITSPSSLSEVSGKNVSIEVTLQDEGNGFDRVEFTLNGQLQYTEKEFPYTGKVRLSSNLSAGDTIEVTAKAYDKYGYSGSSTIELKIGE